MSISACQNDHGGYTLNGTSVTTNAATKVTAQISILAIDGIIYSHQFSTKNFNGLRFKVG